MRLFLPVEFFDLGRLEDSHMTTAAALLAFAAYPAVLAEAATAALPPHSLHRQRSRPCSQMLAPPHSLHLLRCFPCSQMLAPPP